VVNHGNLVLLGARNWGDVDASTIPELTAAEAATRVRAHLEPLVFDGTWRKPALELVPMARGKDPAAAPGHGLTYRLVWVLSPRVSGDLGHYEALVDARDGELLAFEDTNRYASTRRVQGGVLPESNDGIGNEGVEQAGWPMPFADLDNAGTNYFTDEGGNLLRCVDGTITTQLAGRYLLMNDDCGAISESTSSDVLDLGTSGGIDCTVPPGASPGNTHASRSGFYEINRIKEMARSQVPGNAWLQQQLLANMNINNTCNAFWGGGAVNFYRSGGGCNNTGELAGVFDHEWGHGMDDNDVSPGISNPGEGVADIYASLRLNTSCMGRGFWLGSNCNGYGDPCTQCDGVRDIDWANRASGQPHDVAWIDANCGSGGGTPCGGSTHCEGAVYAEAVWDLFNRDLPARYGMDLNTSLEIATRLTYLGAGPVGNWFQCTTPFGGCNADGGYLNYLAADDDNGNLADGTPHMQAIFDAFDRHQIACNSPAVADSGCSGGPTVPPTVSASGVDRGSSLSWGGVAGASSYQVFRTDGVFGCDFGKIKVGETTGTSFVDSGLQNGRSYYYTVIPIGPADSCLGPASACATVVPAAGPNLAIDTASAAVALSGGDGDDFLDNCESGSLTFDVNNIGNAALSNARITQVTPVSHPSVTVTTSLPAPLSPASIAQCATASGSFDFTADGLAYNDTVVFEVEVTSDELAAQGLSKTASFTVRFAESDFEAHASRTFTYEADIEDWRLQSGTFGRTGGGGAQSTSFFVASSDNLPDQCDHIRSPALRLSASSTLSLYNQFDIEAVCGFPNCSPAQWFDRANLGIYTPDDGSRSVVDPDGGRQYNASGINGTCGTSGQNGWADSATSWAQSTWSATALDSGALAGQVVQLDVRYGTDELIQGFGFHFDQVTLTDFELQVADTQSDSCVPQTCGNGVREGSEECDGPDLGGAACSDVGCSTGSVSCTGLCTLDYSACSDCLVCGDDLCEMGEDCLTCATDCPSFPLSGASCGNGLCEAGDGENCVTCPADCNGKQNGKPSGRFCCGDGGGENPVGCGDSRCTSGGFACTSVPQGGGGSTCCGDLVCEAPEDSFNCALDCGAPPTCGDGTCDPGESQCSCAADCGTPPSVETGLCTDGVDNDCDLFVDCDDSDCAGDAACVSSCGNGICEVGEDCNSCSADCDGKQNGNPSGRYCCGDGIPQGPEGNGDICDGNF